MTYALPFTYNTLLADVLKQYVLHNHLKLPAQNRDGPFTALKNSELSVKQSAPNNV
jgi:hypothetical protein